jgi:hypothetical protein
MVRHEAAATPLKGFLAPSEQLTPRGWQVREIALWLAAQPPESLPPKYADRLRYVADQLGCGERDAKAANAELVRQGIARGRGRPRKAR